MNSTLLLANVRAIHERNRFRIGRRAAYVVSFFASVLAIGCAEERANKPTEQTATSSREIRATEQSNTPALQPVPADIVLIAKDYSELRLMTPEPVYVNFELITSCIGVSKQMVDAVRADHGPHANCSIKVFMNELAARAYHSKSNYPTGSIVVKEKNMQGYRSEDNKSWEGDGNGVGGMIKRPAGYDPDYNDWEYFYQENDGAIESGKIPSCIDCHANARETDFVFGDWSSFRKQDSPAGGLDN